MAPCLPAEILVKIIKAYVKPYTLELGFAPQPLDGYGPDELAEFIPALLGLPALGNIRLVNKMFNEETRQAMQTSYDGRFHVGRMTPLGFMEVVLSRTETFFWLRPLIQEMRLVSDSAGHYHKYAFFDTRPTRVCIPRSILPNVRNVVIEYWKYNPAMLRLRKHQWYWKDYGRWKNGLVRLDAIPSVDAWAHILPLLWDSNVNIEFQYMAAYNVNDEALQADVDIKREYRGHEIEAKVREWRMVRKPYGRAQPCQP